MAVFTSNKVRSSGDAHFDGMFSVQFPPITVTKNVANTATASSVALGCNVRILQVSCLVTSANADVTYSGLNIVASTAAEGAVGANGVAAVSGQLLFTADTGQVPVITTAGAVTLFPVPVTLSSQIWPATLALTVRLVSPNTGTASGTLNVSMLCIPWDVNSSLPLYDATGLILQI